MASSDGGFTSGGYSFDKGGNITGVSDSAKAAKTAATIERTSSSKVSSKFKGARQTAGIYTTQEIKAQELAKKQEAQRQRVAIEAAEAEQRRQAYFKQLDEERSSKGLPPTGLVKDTPARQVVLSGENSARTPGPQESRTDIGSVEKQKLAVETSDKKDTPTFSVYNPKSFLEVKGGYKTPTMAIKEFGQSAFPKIFGYSDQDVRMQEAIAAGTGGYKGNFITTREKLIESFEGVGKFAAEEKLYPVPQFGSVDTSTVSPKTKGEVAIRDIDLVQIGTGDIEKAEDSFRKATGRSPVQRGISAGLTTADIGIGVAASVASPVASAVYFGATAAFAAQELERKRLQGYGAATFREQADVLLRGGFALTGGLSALKNIEKQIVAGELKRLAESPVKFGEVVIQSADDSLGSIKAVQRSGGLTREFEITGKIIREGDKLSIMPQAKGVAKTRGILGWNIQGGSKFSRIVSVQKFEAGSRALSVIDKDLIKTISRDVIRPQVSATTIYQGAFDEKAIQRAIKKQVVGGDDIIDWSGSVIKKVGQLDDITIYKAKAGKFGRKMSDRGVIAVTTKAEKDVIKSFTGTGGKTPFVSPVVEQTSKFISLASSATRSIKPPSLPKTPPLTTKLSQSLYAFGKPLYASTLTTDVKTTTTSPSMTFSLPSMDVKTNQNLKTDLSIKQELRSDTLTRIDTKTKSSLTSRSKQDASASQDIKLDTITKTNLQTSQELVQPIPQIIGPGAGGFDFDFRLPKPPPPIGGEIIIPKSSPFKKPGGRFGVEVRRFGEFRNVGTFSSVDKALARGKEVTSGTLAATFRVTGATALPKAIKGFRTKKTGKGIEFIEKKELRLSKIGEVEEIKLFQTKKKKKKSTKKRSTNKNK